MMIIIALFAALAAPPDLRLELARESLTGTHCRYRLHTSGLPTDDYLVRPCSGSEALQRVESNARPVEGRRVVDGRVVRREVVYESPLQPWAHDYDDESGALVRRVPLFYRAAAPARAFDPNPVVSLNDPTLQDRNDDASAVPPAAYKDVVLQDVANAGALGGPYVEIVDRQLPAIAPPDAAGALAVDRADDRFEAANAYFHIDRNQRHVQSLGFTGSRAIAAYPVETDVHAVSGGDNSFFLPSLTSIGRGTLYFGDGGTDDAEDGDLLVHEYGHALLEWVAPGTFGGTFASQARALAEGFGDYWAYSAHVDARLASGRDPFCFADWDARCWEDNASERCAYGPGSDCLRRLDSPRTMANYDLEDRAGVEHENGAIWSSALREIHASLGRRVTDTIVLESLFGVASRPTFAVLARRMLEADRLLYGGANAGVICAAMTGRAILASCDDRPRGELTLHAANDRGIAIPDLSTITSTLNVTDARAIERVLVRVDLEHTSRGDLRVELIAPDGTTVVLQQPSIDRGRSVHATFGLNAAPAEPLDVLRGRRAAGTWQLRVTDARAIDAGTLQSWGLLLQLAGDVTAQERPQSERTQMIPVVTSLRGANATEYRSDLRLANVTGSPVTATLIFTPSGHDGRTSFVALDVALNAEQTVAFDDVVDSAFATSGSGSLQILGEVVAMSRTYALTAGGTAGQQVPPGLPTTTEERQPLLLAPMEAPNTRVNLGITETSGRSGTVSVGGRTIPIAAWSHVQFAVEPGVLELSADGATVVAYLSQVDNTSGDAMFIPGEPLPLTARTRYAPVISREGADREWRSDFWLASVTPAQTMHIGALGAQTPSAQIVGPDTRQVLTYIDVLARLFQRTVTFAALEVPLPAGVIGGTRVASGNMSQFIPLVDPDAPQVQNLLFAEHGGAYRTNVGMVSDGPFRAQFLVYDSAGRFISGLELGSEVGGAVQSAIDIPVTNGRVRVQLQQGQGRAYLSLVDSRTGDATFVAGQ